MMFKIKRQPTRLAVIIRWTQYSFLVVGVLALSYCAVVLINKWAFQAYQTWRFDRALKDAQASEHANPQPASSVLSSQDNLDPADRQFTNISAGSPLGRLEISSIGIAAMIMEGIGGKTLQVAVGHIPRTAFPGQHGNIGLAAHRDTFFRPLRNIHKDDVIVLTTLRGPYRYIVDSTQIVDPDDISVLAATPDDVLTLVSCYPFYYVGPAPKRFIVRAHRIID